MSVINTIKRALPDMQATLPEDIRVSFEFDQSPYVTRAVMGVLTEGTLGAVLVGTTRTPALILSRDDGDSVAYGLVERGENGRWSPRWRSPRRRC